MLRVEAVSKICPDGMSGSYNVMCHPDVGVPWLVGQFKRHEESYFWFFPKNSAKTISPALLKAALAQQNVLNEQLRQAKEHTEHMASRKAEREKQANAEFSFARL